MKKIVVTTLQFAVTVFILWLLFGDAKRRGEMWAALQTANPWWLAAAVVAFGVVIVAAILRWGILLRVQNIAVPLPSLSALFMIGLFFNFLMPGGTGGDVAKIFYLIRSTPDRKAAAVLATLVDRMVGLFSLIFLSAILIAINYSTLVASLGSQASGVFKAFVILLSAAVFGLFSSFVIIGFGVVDKLPVKLPGRAMLLELTAAYAAYGKEWKATLAAAGLSILIHICSFVMFYFAARSIALSPPILDFCAKMPVISTLTALPLSVSGIGVREGLFAMFFPSFPTALAALIGTLGFLAMLVWGLLGGALYLIYRPSHAPKLSEMEAAVETVEHQIENDAERGAGPA